MAKPNYQFEKRQRDLAKKRKQEEKQRQKLANKAVVDGGGQDVAVNSPETAPSDADSSAVAPPDSETKPET
ncbi:MAG: hypothetical protein WBP86_13015 [Thiobacillaceae bacterium]